MSILTVLDSISGFDIGINYFIHGQNVKFVCGESLSQN